MLLFLSAVHLTMVEDPYPSHVPPLLFCMLWSFKDTECTFEDTGFWKQTWAYRWTRESARLVERWLVVVGSWEWLPFINHTLVSSQGFCVVVPRHGVWDTRVNGRMMRGTASGVWAFSADIEPVLKNPPGFYVIDLLISTSYFITFCPHVGMTYNHIHYFMFRQHLILSAKICMPYPVIYSSVQQPFQ